MPPLKLLHLDVELVLRRPIETTPFYQEFAALGTSAAKPFPRLGRLRTPGQTRAGRRPLRVSASREGARNAVCLLEAEGIYRRGIVRSWATRSFLPSPTIRSPGLVSQEERK